MHAEAGGIKSPAVRRMARPTAWKLALLAGFVTQLMLIVFVTAIGLRQLGMTTRNLNQVVDVHMRKQNHTKSMVTAARERTVILLMLPLTHDLFERDALQQQFNAWGQSFGAARQALLDLPLNDKEKALIALQGQLTGNAQPVQLQVIDLIDADFVTDANDLVRNQAIPMQNEVMTALSQLEGTSQTRLERI